MSDIVTTIQGVLVDGETIISVADNLRYGIRFVPNISPTDNWSTEKYLSGTLALTNYRIIIVMWDGQVWKWIYISGINWYSERFLSKDKPSWPYQAVMMLPSGMALIIETEKSDKEKQNQLSNLLKQAFLTHSTKKEDIGALAAIIDDENKKRAIAASNSSKKE